MNNDSGKNRSYSYSEISTAYKCNKLFQYLYVDKLRPAVPTSADLKFGTAIHLGLETLLSASSDYIKDFKLFWELEKSKDNVYGRYGHDDLLDQGITLLQRFDKLHKKKLEIIQMEQRLRGFLVQDSSILIEGTPDIIGKFQGVASVIDFKTAGSRYHKDKVRISEQMYLYAYLARQVLGLVIEQVVYIVFVKGKEPSIQTLVHKFTQDELDEAIYNIYLQCLDLKQKELTSTFTKNYHSCIIGEIKCPFFDKCHPKR